MKHSSKEIKNINTCSRESKIHQKLLNPKLPVVTMVVGAGNVQLAENKSGFGTFFPKKKAEFCQVQMKAGPRPVPFSVLQLPWMCGSVGWGVGGSGLFSELWI